MNYLSLLDPLSYLLEYKGVAFSKNKSLFSKKCGSEMYNFGDHKTQDLLQAIETGLCERVFKFSKIENLTIEISPKRKRINRMGPTSSSKI